MKMRRLAGYATGLLLVIAVALVTQACGSTVDKGSVTSPASQVVTLDPDTVYKNHCTRCHSELPKTDEGATVTVVRHMRVRANLTEAEAKAVLDYLTQ